MNLQLERVLSDMMGTTGQLIIRAIVAGERDPVILAQHRNPACKASTETIAKALTDAWLVLCDVYTAQIAVCDSQIEQTLQAIESRSGDPHAPVPDLPPAKADSKTKNAPPPETRAQ